MTRRSHNEELRRRGQKLLTTPDVPPSPGERQAAVLAVASRATTPADLVELLDALGLDAADGSTVPSRQPGRVDN